MPVNFKVCMTLNNPNFTRNVPSSSGIDVTAELNYDLLAVDYCMLYLVSKAHYLTLFKSAVYATQ